MTKLQNGHKIFIAGVTGMVGSAVKRALLKNDLTRQLSNIKIVSPKRYELDLFDQTSVNIWFEKNKPDIVILAAAKVGGIEANSSYPADFLIENLKIQTNVIEAAFINGVKRLLFLGSSCIYPKNCSQPIKEEYLLSGNLETTNEYYAISKITGLKICESLRFQNGFDTISLMPTNLYGPNDNYHPQNSHVIASLIRKFLLAKVNKQSSVTCWGDGSPLREFLHVDDLAEAIIFCLKEWDPENKESPKDNLGNPLNHLNVGTGKEISIKYLARLIAEITDFKGKINWDTSKPNGTIRKVLDVRKINQLGWSSKISLRDGIVKTIKELNPDNFNIKSNSTPNS
tara:strand:- start:3007 stop:4032 length:1026 start_codon:yes stop_codon:yes gene_type:complete